MRYKKLVILMVLFFAVAGFMIAPASAVKYKDKCYSGKSYHKTTWSKTYYGKSFDKYIYKNGHKYKRYVNLYKYKCKCTNMNQHSWQNKLWGQPLKTPYKYETISNNNRAKSKYGKYYSYKKIY